MENKKKRVALIFVDYYPYSPALDYKSYYLFFNRLDKEKMKKYKDEYHYCPSLMIRYTGDATYRTKNFWLPVDAANNRYYLMGLDNE